MTTVNKKVVTIAKEIKSEVDVSKLINQFCDSMANFQGPFESKREAERNVIFSCMCYAFCKVIRDIKMANPKLTGKEIKKEFLSQILDMADTFSESIVYALFDNKENKE